jgi:hypothetical protein
MAAKHPVQVFNGIRFYRKGRGYYKAGFEESGRRTVYMHRYVWEFHNGPIPPKHHVHHANGNTGDNRIENLALMLGTDHSRQHALERIAAGALGTREHLAAARVAAAKWHGSPEGLAWHSVHGKDTWTGREKQQHICLHCGKPYEALIGVRKRGFCSPSCQGMARIASGVDDETRACVVCGAEFQANKYRKTKTCSKVCASAALVATRARLRNIC